MKFDLSYISQSIVRGLISSPKFYLNLYDANPQDIGYSQSLYAYPISQSWVSGEGYEGDIPVTQEGASWDYRTGANDEIYWISASMTSSYKQGGTFYTASYGSQSFAWGTEDMRMDVTPVVNKWLDETYPNEGFILKHDSAKENDTIDYGQLKFFSKETNTIYQPKLRIGWDDSSFITGSLTELTSDDIHVTFKRLKTRYKQGSKPEIRVFGREKYPLKTYTNQYSYTDVYYLPTSSYYQIKDIITEEVIVPFGDYTKLSCDSNGNYFKLNLTNWEYNRDYYIEIKTDRDGVVEYFVDKDLTFTVEK